MIPSTPPIPENIIDVNENADTPHSAGIYAPAVEPKIAPIQMRDLFMRVIC